MVVLAVAVLGNKGTKIIASRQFVEMSRIRIEGLLIAFPKLIGTGGQQHTYVETDTVRYVYQPMETLYLLLITNKSSNIVEDLETLRLLSQIVPDLCPVLDDKTVQDAAFEIIFAIDEIISLGHKESINMSQLKSNLSMVSHDEQIAKMLKKSREDTARDMAKQRARELTEQKRREGGVGGGSFRGGVSSDDAMRSMAFAGGAGGAGAGGMPGGSDSISSDSGYGSGFGGAQSSSSSLGGAGRSSSSSTVGGGKPGSGAGAASGGAGGARRGMQLSKKMKKEDQLKELLDEANLPSVAPAAGATSSSAGGASASAAVAAVPLSSAPVVATIEETVSVRLNREGGVDHLEVKGALMLEVNDSSSSKVRLMVSASDTNRFQMKTHPNINKDVFMKDNLLQMKDTSRGFPTGNALGVLRWRFQAQDEGMVPLTVSCWPSPGTDGSVTTTIEYELQRDVQLEGVVISIPCPAAPTVSQVDSGSYKFDPKQEQLRWTIDYIDNENKSGTMEFSLKNAAKFTFFPVMISFSSKQTLCDVQVSEVQNLETNEPVRFAQHSILKTEEYSVE